MIITCPNCRYDIEHEEAVRPEVLPTVPVGWRLVPDKATVRWSGQMKGCGFDGTNFQAQQYITLVLRAAPQFVPQKDWQ